MSEHAHEPPVTGRYAVHYTYHAEPEATMSTSNAAEPVWKRGDFAGFAAGGPGPDLYFVLVLDDSEDGYDVKVFDPWFETMLDMKPSELWPLTERHLAMQIGTERGTTVVGEVLEHWRRALVTAPIHPE